MTEPQERHYTIMAPDGYLIVAVRTNRSANDQTDGYIVGRAGNHQHARLIRLCLDDNAAKGGSSAP